MAESETGWTKEWPNVNGYYWRRINQRDPASLVRIVGDECRFTDGSSEGRHECYEYLGPLSPADAEQLHELRRLVREFLTIDPAKDVSQWCEIEQQLERAVGINTNPKQPEKETQGK